MLREDSMYVQFPRAIVATIAASLLSSVIVAAGRQEPILKITAPESAQKAPKTRAAVPGLDQKSAFYRLHPTLIATADVKRLERAQSASRSSSFLKGVRTPSAVGLMSLGTGGGDIVETEPNDQIAQNVSLPVNVLGTIGTDGDVDFFTFQAFAGQQITIEAFAARIPGSELIADIALFNSAGQLLTADAGGTNFDPFVTFTPDSDQVLIAGIADVDNLGGPFSTYILNVTRGVDVDEAEPNDATAQSLASVPATVFGTIDSRSDVDFYSFVGNAGQTLIVDVDAEVIGSGLDSEINLMDPTTGVEYFFNDDSEGQDSRFNIVLPHTGRYVVGIGAFEQGSRGFYRLNISLVPGNGAPLITSVTRVSKKIFEVSGSGFSAASSVELNSDSRSTTFIDAGTLRGKGKAKSGSVVTVSNAPDGRRSNPLVVP
jgi:hypothetical protein